MKIVLKEMLDFLEVFVSSVPEEEICICGVFDWKVC